MSKWIKEKKKNMQHLHKGENLGRVSGADLYTAYSKEAIGPWSPFVQQMSGIAGKAVNEQVVVITILV